MSSTSTNKQPLLVDRPLHEFVILGPTAALIDQADYTSVLSGGCQELVNCSSNDGAVIDSLSLFAPQALMTPVVVIFFLSTSSSVLGISASNTVPVASSPLGSSAAGARTNVSLPLLSIPVPHAGGPVHDSVQLAYGCGSGDDNLTSATYAVGGMSEISKKNTALLVPSGKVLYAGLNIPVIAPSAASKVVVTAQGGYY